MRILGQPCELYLPSQALLAFAKDRGVRVVLELDMPGHNWAYSVAFPHLFANCSGEKAARGVQVI